MKQIAGRDLRKEGPALVHHKPFTLARRKIIGLCAFLFLVLPAYPQITLTGAGTFAATPAGATSVEQAYADGYYNTLGGDQWWNLWLALNPDATLPVNGPSDGQANIAIALHAGKTYKYYLFGGDCCFLLSHSGLNLFFDGNNSVPGISVFGVSGGLGFTPNSSSTLSLSGDPVAGSGSSFYKASGLVVVLTEFVWSGFQRPPGNVCQPFEFTPNPDGNACSYGSFKLHVFPAAIASVSQPSGSPGSTISISGSEVLPGEIVSISAGSIGARSLGTVVADSGGAFFTNARVPQHPNGT